MLWFKKPDGLTPNLVLFTYLILAYPAALWCLLSPALFAAGVLLLTHVLVLSAYLLHDCLHNNIFSVPAHNERLGKFLTWVVGAVYSPYAVLREKHFRHHIERADILALNYRAYLVSHPTVDRLVRTATHLHLPAVELLLQWLDLIAPFHLPERRHLRSRTILILMVRASLFLCLLLLSPLAAIGYVLAYVLFLWVMGFMDAFQHTYDIHYRLLQPQLPPGNDRNYEEENTYSNLLSGRFPLINLLILNFCYHNVHHHKSSEPWYRLPALHTEFYASGDRQVIPLAKQLTHFHRYRLARIHHADSDRVTGVDGVSFLVGV